MLYILPELLNGLHIVLAFAIVLPSAKVFTNLRVDECDVNDIPISSFQP